MGAAFRRNLHVTSSFFLLRLVVSLGVAVAYIFVAATIQYLFVELMGESTFNYIAGGLLSLLLGAGFCSIFGALVFMFVRGWHVAALAYAKKIEASGAPPITVGMAVFGRNLVSFGAVYGVRAIVRSISVSFTEYLWDLLEGVPVIGGMKSLAENPVIEHMARSVLDYGFDATIFYLIRNKPEDLDDVPDVVLEGLRKYLCCLPSILITAIGTYGLFEVVPAIVKAVVVFIIFMRSGICAGILITVLLLPLFYILDNTLFKPLTMMMFMTCFAATCDKDVDADSKVAQVANAILSGLTGEGNIDAEEEQAASEEDSVEPKKPAEAKREQHSQPEEQPDLDSQVLEPEAPVTAGPLDLNWEEEPPQEPPVVPLTQPPSKPPASAMEEMLRSLGREAPAEPRVHEEPDASPGGILGLGDALSQLNPDLLNGGFDEED